MNYTLVDDNETLQKAATALAGSPRLFLDTEFESNKSGTRLCLLQVSAGADVFLLDTIKLGSLDALKPVFAARATEWVLHAGLQDVFLISERLKIAPPQLLFDTQVAWALLTAENSVSLAYLQFKLLGVRSSKAHQADDWIRRPLQNSQLRYAASDVEYLPALSEELARRAEAKQRLEVVRAASAEALTPTRESTPALRLESFRNAWQLEAPQQAGLLFLIDWYNRLSAAEKRDAPDTKTLLSIASRLPENLEVLGRIKGVHRGIVANFGRQMVNGMAYAAANAKVADFTPIDPPPYATFAEARLDAWLGTLRAEICTDLEVAPEFVLPSRVQKDLKNHLLEHGGAGLDAALSGFRSGLLGAKIREFCGQHPPPL